MYLSAVTFYYSCNCITKCGFITVYWMTLCLNLLGLDNRLKFALVAIKKSNFDTFRYFDLKSMSI